MAMQNTASLWVQLCEELEARRATQSAGECSAAARRFEEAAREVFKNRASRLRDALEIAGDIHQASGAWEDAERTFSEALAMTDNTVSAAARARIATKLAIGNEAAGNAPAAIQSYAIAIEAHESVHDRSELPTLLNNLAGLQRAAGDLDAAEKSYLRAMDEAVATHGASHPEVALIANNLAVAYTDHGNLRKAEELHLRALQIREEAFGAIHPEVGQSMANLAVVHHARGQSRKAERLYLAAMETLSHFHAPDSPELQRIRMNYEKLPHIRARQLSKTMKL